MARHAVDASGKQLLTTMKQQNHVTGRVEPITVPLVEDLEPRAYIVRLTVGQEVVQRDLCWDCLKTVQHLIRPLWSELEKMESK